MRRFMWLILILLAALAACAKEESKDEGNAPKVVEDYLKAKVASDATKLVSLACKAQEAKANQDANSFKSVKAELQDMKCKQAGKDGSAVLVSCEGNIHVDYGGETRDFNLNTTQYRAVQEDGEWKWCGEKVIAPQTTPTAEVTEEPPTPAEAAENYLQVLVTADAEQLLPLACQAYQDQAQEEAQSFESMTGELQNVQCAESGQDGDSVLVSCEGSISVEYNNETRELSLSGKIYQMVQEDGAWKWCGEQ